MITLSYLSVNYSVIIQFFKTFPFLIFTVLFLWFYAHFYLFNWFYWRSWWHDLPRPTVYTHCSCGLIYTYPDWTCYSTVARWIQLMKTRQFSTLCWLTVAGITTGIALLIMTLAMPVVKTKWINEIELGRVTEYLLL